MSYKLYTKVKIASINDGYAHLDKQDEGTFRKASFDPNIVDLKHRYESQYYENIMGNYIWSLVREKTMKEKLIGFNIKLFFYYFII